MMWEPQCHRCVGKGAVTWSWGRGRVSLHSFQWPEWGQASTSSPLSPTLHEVSLPLSSLFHVLSDPLPLTSSGTAVMRVDSEPQKQEAIEKRQVRCPGCYTCCWSKSEEISVPSPGHISQVMTLPPASSIQHHSNTQCSNHSGILWTSRVIPCREGICGHRWEGKTGVLFSNYINRHSPNMQNSAS